MIKKAVLPVAGFGTRFLPASKATPKEMLPIIDKPLVQYAVEEAIDSGINEIIFITSPEKHSIKKHFKTNKDLENRLQNSSKEEMIEKLNPKKFSKAKFYYINQNEQNGLGHAVLQAESIIGNNSFAVLLPDDLFFSRKSCLDQLIDIFKEKNIETDLIIARAFKPLPIVLDLANRNFKKFKSVILFLGKNRKKILDKALTNWSFDYKEKISLTSSESKIIKICNLKKKF